MDQEAWVFKKVKGLEWVPVVWYLSWATYNFLNLTNDLSNAKALHSFQLTNAIETNVLKSCNTWTFRLEPFICFGTYLPQLCRSTCNCRSKMSLQDMPWSWMVMLFASGHGGYALASAKAEWPRYGMQSSTVGIVRVTDVTCPKCMRPHHLLVLQERSAMSFSKGHIMPWQNPSQRQFGGRRNRQTKPDLQLPRHWDDAANAQDRCTSRLKEDQDTILPFGFSHQGASRTTWTYVVFNMHHCRSPGKYSVEPPGWELICLLNIFNAFIGLWNPEFEQI